MRDQEELSHETIGPEFRTMTFQSLVSCPFHGTTSSIHFHLLARIPVVLAKANKWWRVAAGTDSRVISQETVDIGIYIMPALTFNICLAPASTTLLLAFFTLSRKLIVFDVVSIENDKQLCK
jgi:hypothetical protein